MAISSGGNEAKGKDPKKDGGGRLGLAIQALMLSSYYAVTGSLATDRLSCHRSYCYQFSFLLISAIVPCLKTPIQSIPKRNLTSKLSRRPDGIFIDMSDYSVVFSAPWYPFVSETSPARPSIGICIVHDNTRIMETDLKLRLNE
ncbi:hypothetical protein V502_08398 [Pseudogymnoascus sp. VKM F-4520 (FW-2644)]|nr:hypothetical protein V502_08398 [Pseudogymnoascus sp. VKM F-4520 (FW-2644)]